VGGDAVADFGTFKINDVIMHGIPKARREEKGTVLPDLTDAAIDLQPQDRSYLNLRMRTTLGGYARPVVESDDEDCPTPALVKGLLNGTEDLVASSRAIAQLMHEKQAGISSPGLLLVVEGELDGDKALLIAKIEHEQGMRVELTENAAGQRVFEAEFLKNLIFGQNTKVFKVGVFSDVDESDRLRGHVVDIQQQSHGVALFFVNRVLGCEFTQRADVLTERFKRTAEKWINTQISDPERQATYEIAILSELKKPSATIAVGGFAQEHIADADERESFLSVMESAGLPKAPMPKDTALIESSIRRVKIQTKRNATILVPPDMKDDGSLTIEDRDDDNRAQITILDEISSMGGASGRKSASS
jgi:hypothetical protein